MLQKTKVYVSAITLIFCFIALPAATSEVDREVLLEIDTPLIADATGSIDLSAVPDLAAFMTRYPGAVTHLAIDQPGNRHQQFNRYLLVRLAEVDRDRVHGFIRDVAALSSVHWATPNYQFQSSFYPDDPDFNEQWGANRIKVQDAWDYTRGSAEIPIAIIDTGCDMDHEDLVNSIWINEDEIPDNGIDDDDNGFIDDFQGWDFVDAPTFPTMGDYLDRDNDPSDEMGHGTAVAGICGAEIDNGIGIAGIAPDCPLMILRAGNANGFLQEDDVASAILYALDNGARVVNMSFGDVQASPMLGDVIDYAAGQGLLMIAASGNNGDDQANYPAAFGPPLCVGSCDSNNERVGDSNYGTALDLLAPGEEIYSTLPDDEYGLMPPTGSGTSFAAPHVSGVAGLVFSLHPNWDAQEVKSILRVSTDDLDPPGWDPETGHGILRADYAVLVDAALVAEITQPVMGEGLSQADSLSIIGTAAGAYMESFQVFSGSGENPTSWEPIDDPVRQSVVNDLLAHWRTEDLTDSVLTFRLVVTDIFGREVSDRVTIYIDSTPPVISNISLFPILDADRPSYLLTFNTDDVTSGKVWLQGIEFPDERWISQSLGYESTDHTILLGRDLPLKEYQYYIWIENASGLIDSTDILGTLDLGIHSVQTDNFVELPPPGIPPGYLFQETSDFDGDGYLEVWADSTDPVGNRTGLRVFEASNDWPFIDLGLNFGLEIPKSFGDSDVDGITELLTLYAGKSKIFEPQEAGSFPDPEIIYWQDNSGYTWGAKLMNLDDVYPYGEVLLEVNGQYKLYRNSGSGNLQFSQTLSNPFNPDTSATFPPYCKLNDYDNDGLNELLFGDYDGNLWIYERQTSGLMALTWSTQLPQLDTGEFLTDGDFNGDGNVDFAAMAHTETILSGEHLADTRYWALYIFTNTGPNQYTIIDTTYIFGAENPADFSSGIDAGDVLGEDGDSEILLCVYPEFYVLDWSDLTDQMEVAWYYPECNSNTAVIGDFNRNGQNEFLFNNGSMVKVFEAVGDWSFWPPPPINFQAEALTNRVNLSWDPVEGADRYNLYRGSSPSTLQLLGEIMPPATDTTDFGVVLNTTYYYAVSTVDQSADSIEGYPTPALKAIPNEAPYVVGDTAHFTPPHFVTVEFSEPMNSTLLDVSNYWIMGNTVQPASIVSEAGGSKAVLTFNVDFEDSMYYQLKIHEVYDLQGSYFSNIENPDTLKFFVPQVSGQANPYLKSALVSAGYNVIALIFSETMREAEASNRVNYSITVDPVNQLSNNPPIIVESAELDTSLRTTIYLTVDPSTPIGPFGKVYRVTANNLYSNAGLPLDTDHNSAALGFNAKNLNKAFVYPNPYKSGITIGGEDCVIFANLTENCTIRILNISGIVIRTIHVSDNVSGGVRWYMDNERGEKVGSGIYIFKIDSDNSSFTGKLAVVR